MCSKVWPSESNARKHVREHDLDPGAEKERTCQHCSKIFSSQVLHRLHDHQGCSLHREVQCGECKVQKSKKKKEGVNLTNNLEFEEDGSCLLINYSP